MFFAKVRPIAYVKIGYVEQLDKLGVEPYRIGGFGSHQVKYFSSEAFNLKPSDRKFFNFWSAANRLHDEANYLEFLEERNLLPDVLLMAITTPNNDNGSAIIGGDPNMPISRLEWSDYWSAMQAGDWERLKSYSAIAPDLIVRETNHVFNYITFLIGLLRGDQVTTVDMAECPNILRAEVEKGSRETENGLIDKIMDRMPLMIKNALGQSSIGFYCREDQLHESIRSDGSSHFEHEELVLNERILSDATSQLTSGDEEKIIAALVRIYEVAKRNNRTIAFFIPPVYETERYGLADRIVTHAIEILNERHPQIHDVLVDDRYVGRGRPKLFNIYDHPNASYYRELVAKLIERGILDNSTMELGL